MKSLQCTRTNFRSWLNYQPAVWEDEEVIPHDSYDDSFLQLERTCPYFPCPILQQKMKTIPKGRFLAVLCLGTTGYTTSWLPGGLSGQNRLGCCSYYRLPTHTHTHTHLSGLRQQRFVAHTTRALWATGSGEGCSSHCNTQGSRLLGCWRAPLGKCFHDTGGMGPELCTSSLCCLTEVT